MKAIVNGKILTKDEVIENKILLFDEKIIGFVDEVNEDMEIIDGKNLYISPGLIDLHIHGSANYDTMDNINTAVEIIGKSIIKNGVTSFLPTTMTMSQKDIYNALNNIKQYINKKYSGAEVLGAHLEGPFINNNYKGAQSNKYIQEPSFCFIKNYIDIIKIISYSPETDKNLSFTKEIKEKTNIVYLVEENVMDMKDYIEEKGLELIFDTDIEEKIISCDKTEIERCIINLVGNAAKFTPKGGLIQVIVSDLGDKVKISVKDNGIGISEENKKLIFNRFNQVVENNSEVKGGSGLGLTISKQLISLHGGDIYVESEVGVGSEFIIILPVEND